MSTILIDLLSDNDVEITLDHDDSVTGGRRDRALHDLLNIIGELVDSHNQIAATLERILSSHSDPSPGFSARRNLATALLRRSALMANGLISLLGSSQVDAGELALALDLPPGLPGLQPAQPAPYPIVHYVCRLVEKWIVWREAQDEGEELGFEVVDWEREMPLWQNRHHCDKDVSRAAHVYRRQLLQDFERLVELDIQYYAVDLMLQRGWTWQRAFSTAIHQHKRRHAEHTARHRRPRAAPPAGSRDVGRSRRADPNRSASGGGSGREEPRMRQMRAEDAGAAAPVHAVDGDHPTNAP